MSSCFFCDSPAVKQKEVVKSFESDFVSLFWKYFSFSDSHQSQNQLSVNLKIKNQHHQAHHNNSNISDNGKENSKSQSNTSHRDFCGDCTSNLHQLNQRHLQIQKIIASLSAKIISLPSNGLDQNPNQKDDNNSKECKDEVTRFRTQVVNRLLPRVILNSSPAESLDVEIKAEPILDNEKESSTPPPSQQEESNDIDDFEPSPIPSDHEPEPGETTTKNQSKKRKRKQSEVVQNEEGEKTKMKRIINSVENLGNGKFLYMGKEFEEKSGRFRCSTCTKYNKNKKNMLKHIKMLHTQGDYTCSSCVKSFSSESLLISHVCSSIQIGLRILEIEPGKFVLGERWLFERDEDRMKCSICLWTTKTKEGMSDHIKVKHAEMKPYFCDVCAKSFLNKQFLDAHIATHSSDRPELCHLCAKSFKCRHDLLKHIRLIHKSNRVNCPDCSHSCKNSVVLNRHRKTRCPGKISQQETTTTPT